MSCNTDAVSGARELIALLATTFEASGGVDAHLHTNAGSITFVHICYQETFVIEINVKGNRTAWHINTSAFLSVSHIS